MSRIVGLKLGIKLEQFSDTVVSEFGLSEEEHITSLSYWPVDASGFVTSAKTPPGWVKSDCALDFFLSELKVNKSLTLFVKFHSSAKRGSDVLSPSSSGFSTPATVTKRQRVFTTPCSSNKSNHKVSSNDLSEAENVGLGSVGSKRNPILIDDDLIAEAKLAEALYSATKGKGKKLDIESDSDEEEATVGGKGFPAFDLGIDTPVFYENDTRPRGYDTDFWRKFIDNEYGGSNVVEIMCPKEGMDTNKWMKRKEVLCSSNNAFDHMVVLNGESSTRGGMPKKE
ncbi:unnamed protein product [Arabis nemorensis]|uniref:Uncharacterized protein n=1 Tax=Arabis nemorensis TaxID=586526 RepID=A0A565BJ50_9BRAS|nr:unnamed protein product [Arabis nemorensis]